MSDIIEKLREYAQYAETRSERDTFEATINEITSLREENARLRCNFKLLADAVRVAKEAASYNRHKSEHCISRSMWSALSDQEKYARKILDDLRADALKETGND